MPSNLQAAMAFAQFKRIDELLFLKREIYKNYRKGLNGLNIKFNLDNYKSKNGLWATVAHFHSKYKIDIESLIKYLSKNNIFARRFFKPLTLQEAYKKYSNKKEISKISYYIFKNSIVLPSHFNLTAEDIFYISSKIKSYIKKKI